MKKRVILLLIISVATFYAQNKKVKIFVVGDVIKVGESYQFSVEKDGIWELPKNDFIEQEKDKIFYYVLVYIKNIGTESLSYNRLNFSLKDSRGFLSAA